MLVWVVLLVTLWQGSVLGQKYLQPRHRASVTSGEPSTLSAYEYLLHLASTQDYNKFQEIYPLFPMSLFQNQGSTTDTFTGRRKRSVFPPSERRLTGRKYDVIDRRFARLRGRYLKHNNRLSNALRLLAGHGRRLANRNRVNTKQMTSFMRNPSAVL